MAEAIPKKRFSDRPVEAYLCGRCKKGHLTPEPDSFAAEEPGFSANARDGDFWEPDWLEYRFTFRCRCSNSKCGEISFVAGSGVLDQRYDYDGQPEYFDSFKIHSFFPAPYLAEVPRELPDKVLKSLERSFLLYWADTSAAANALRASLEFVLDELKVPRTQKRDDGSEHRLNLHQRIDAAEKQKPELKDLFLALKDVGNLGSHGGDVADGDYSDAVEIFAHILTSLFQDDAKRIKELAQKLSAKMKEGGK